MEKQIKQAFEIVKKLNLHTNNALSCSIEIAKLQELRELNDNLIELINTLANK